MIIDKLKQLAQGNQPQSLDELFQGSKEGMMSDRVVQQVNMLLPAMEQRIAESIKVSLADVIKNEVGKIKVRDGRDGRDAKPAIAIDGKDGERGADGKTPTRDELLALIAPLIPRGKRGGGGSTMRVDNLSSQANGVTRSFTTTHRIGSAHLLFYSSFPTFFLPTTDYSVLGTTVSLVATIDPPVAGQSLAIFYESSD